MHCKQFDCGKNYLDNYVSAQVMKDNQESTVAIATAVHCS